MNIRDVVGRLDLTKPADLLAHKLARHVSQLDLDGQLDLAHLTEIQPQIDDAINEIESHRLACRRMIDTCQHLSPQPSKKTPIGL